MRQRCSNPNNHAYKDYGERGIKVCDAWSTFQQFLYDMGLPESEELELDRIDNNGNYEPSNCRWTTAKENGNNKRMYMQRKYRGVYQIKNGWVAKIWVDSKILHLGRADTDYEAAKLYNACALIYNKPLNNLEG